MSETDCFDIFGNPLKLNGMVFMAIGSIREGFVIERTKQSEDAVSVGRVGEIAGVAVVVTGVRRDKKTLSLQVSLPK